MKKEDTNIDVRNKDSLMRYEDNLLSSEKVYRFFMFVFIVMFIFIIYTYFFYINVILRIKSEFPGSFIIVIFGLICHYYSKLKHIETIKYYRGLIKRTDLSKGSQLESPKTKQWLLRGFSSW